MEKQKESSYDILLAKLAEAFANRLKAVVLFGSRARGKVKNHKDHDIFLVIEGLSSNPVNRLKEVRSAIWDVDMNLNTIAKTPDEVEANLTPLMLEISLDGICLFGKDYFEPYQEKAKRAVQQAGIKRIRVGNEWHWEFDKFPETEWELSWEGFRELQR